MFCRQHFGGSGGGGGGLPKRTGVFNEEVMFGDQQQQQQQEHLVQLHRDTVSTSWGFRLQGGQETDTPLTVQRVFVGGVSDGKLHRGDVIVGIGGYNARGMYHSQAEEIIKGAGRDVTFKVLRGEGGGGGGDSGSRSTFAQNDYSSYQVPWQTSASAAAAAAAPSWPGTSVDADYEQRSVVDIGQQFSNPSPSGAGRIQMRAEPGSTSYIPKKPVISVRRQGQFDGLSDPGWTPGSSRGQQAAPRASRYVPQSPPVNVPRQPQPQHPPTRPTAEIYHETPDAPAWLGTLRSAGGPKLWEIQEGQTLVGGGAHRPAPVKLEQASRPVYGSTGPLSGGGGGGGGGVQVHSPRIQTARYGPGDAAPTYGQRSAKGVDSDTARLAHLQYNTPINLYSRESAREVLEGQTLGKAGYGTMQITGSSGPSGPGVKIRPFDPVHSDVYRLVLEEDEVRKAGGVVYGADGGGPSGGQRRQQGASNRAASGPHQGHHHHATRPANPAEDQHSARFYQLVHENDDQLDQYASVHPGQYHHREPTVASMRDVPAGAGGGGGGGGGLEHFGVSDF